MTTNNQTEVKLDFNNDDIYSYPLMALKNGLKYWVPYDNFRILRY
jgi:hypothetical protein